MFKKRYKDDYKASPRMDYRGRMVNDYYYVGDYYCLSMNEKERKSSNIINMVFTLAFVAAWILTGMINQDSSRTFWILFPYFFTFLPMIYFFSGAINYWGKTLRLERMAYDAGIGRMHRSGLGIIIMAGINLILDVIYMLLNFRSIHLGKELLYMLGFIIMIIIGLGYAKYYNKYYARVTMEKA